MHPLVLDEAAVSEQRSRRGHGPGLDVARRIVVERHHGTIEIDSAPGRTEMRVRLPLGSTPG